MNALNLVAIELKKYFDTEDEISIKVPEGTLTMVVNDIEEYDIGGEDDEGRYHGATVYSVLSAEGVKLNGEESSVYTDKFVNEKLTSGSWSIAYTRYYQREDY